MSLRHILTAAALFAAILARAQDWDDFPEIKRDTETQAETIAKALKDMDSADAEVRKRAVLILGKYSHQHARAGLIAALADKEAAIRRSALVALINQPVFGDDAMAMLQLIGDPDDSIRRIASTHLPKLLLSWRRIGVRFESGKEIPAAVRRAMLKAFSDKDPIVRKNMVANWRSLFSEVLDNRELVLDRLQDKERDVRILALQAAPILLGTRGFVERTTPLIKDEDQKIRLLLTRLLAARKYAGRLEALKKLAADKDFAVSTEAWIGLLAANDKDAWPTLRKRLEDGRMKGDQAARIISFITVLGEDGRKPLLGLMKHSRAAYRLAALKAYAGSYWRPVDRGLLLKLIEDPSSDIRKTAGALLARERDLPLKTITTLAESRHEENRVLALILAERLDADKSEDLLMGLMLDDKAAVRRRAIAAIAERQIGEWREILTDALIDDDAEVRRIGAAGLLQFGGEKGRQVLQAYLNSGKDEKLKQFIRFRLAVQP